MATKMRLYPSPIVAKGNDIRSFDAKEGKNRQVLVAQRGDGPVLEKIVPLKKAAAPKKLVPPPKRRLQVGEWSSVMVDHYASYEDVRDGLERSLGRYHEDVSYKMILLVEDPNTGSEAEYYLDNGVMYVRHLLSSRDRRKKVDVGE